MSMKKVIGFVAAVLLIAGVGAAEVDTRIKRMLDQNEIQYTINSDMDFRIPFEDGNTVIVNSNVSTYKDIVVREVWVVFGEIGKRSTSLMYKMLLDSNLNKLGAYSIAESDGSVYGLYTIKLSADASWKELWSAILFCASIELPDED